MPITEADIKILASERLTDNEDGGGRITGTVVQDGAENNLFDDISQLDRTYGRVSMRKAFAAIMTSTTDRYFGAHVILNDVPDDPLVGATIFSTENWVDTRSIASARVEAYLNAGPEWPGFLYENHIFGQRSIQLFQRTTQPPPPIGRTLLLRQNEGTGGEFEQYVRITRVESQERTFTDIDGNYQALVITLDISDALRYNFAGTAATRFFTRSSGAAKIRDTVVANAARYFGASPLIAAAAPGDLSAKVASIYSLLVPSSRTETSMADQRPSAFYEIALATSPRAVTVGGAALSQRIRIGQENRGFNYVTILSPLPAPGSLRISFRALGQTYYVADNGDGTIGGEGYPGSGTVNYITGSVSITLGALPDDRSAVIFYWGQRISYTNRAGQAGFRAPEYSFTLSKDGIVPGSVTINWLSDNVLRTASADAAGKLSGDATGEIQHTSGLVFIRPAYMLDPGGEFSLEYEWSPVVEELKTGLSPDSGGFVNFSFSQEPAPGSVECQWFTTRELSESSGATTSSGTTAKASGGNTGKTTVTKPVVFNGLVVDSEAYSGPSGLGAGMGYKAPPFPVRAQVSHVQTSRVDVVDYVMTTTTQSSSSSSASYSSSATQTARTAVTVAHMVTDDGAGAFFGTFGTLSYISLAASLKVVDTSYTESHYEQNYEHAGAWESLNATDVSGGGANPPPSTTSGGGGSDTAKGGEYGTTSAKETYSGAGGLLVRYKTGTIVPQSHVETYTPAAVTIDLAPYTKDRLVPGSLRFNWMGTDYIDIEGKVYRDFTASDSGIVAGDINYLSGVLTMSDYVVNGSPTAFSLASLFTTKDEPHVANITFNTPLAPIKPSALILSVLDVRGDQIIATSNLDGELTGPHTRGMIDYESGLVEVQFGDYVLDAGLSAENKAEWWYDAADIRGSDGKIWRPWPVAPETLRYNFVSYFYLPLDASVIGLDPVRLPQDGRVPIFQAGDVAVIHHTQRDQMPAPLAAGEVFSTGRGRLSKLRVLDATGVQVDGSKYIIDLDAGTVTMAAPLDLSGYTQPLECEHRIEDMSLIRAVDIGGTIAFIKPLTHVFPAGPQPTYVSSAVIIGDMFARALTGFSQQTWTSVWSNDRIGSEIIPQYQQTLYPIEVSNRGCVQERWAIIFTSTTAFRVVGESLGEIAVGNTGVDLAIINPDAGLPYFTIRAGGWGGGWAAGNVFRFNTSAANFPLWIARTVAQGEASGTSDSLQIQIRGDIDQ